jgi:hypothetical protein
MQQTIIHIGYPKTASTWFISHFYPKVKNASVIYANDLTYDLTHGKEEFSINYEKVNNDKEWLIIASHKFSGFVEGMWDGGIYRSFFLKHIKELHPEAHIIVFIRNQLDFIPSLYSSYLRRGGTYKLRTIFSPHDPVDKDFFSYEFLNYPEMIRLYQENFGKDKVHFFLYEEFLEDNRMFLENFVSKFNLDIDLDNLSSVRSNAKLRQGLASLVRVTNHFIAQGKGPKKNLFNWPQVNKRINKNLDDLNRFSIWGKPLARDKMLGKDLHDFICNYFKESNNELINSFGLDAIRKYGYPL